MVFETTTGFITNEYDTYRYFGLSLGLNFGMQKKLLCAVWMVNKMWCYLLGMSIRVLYFVLASIIRLLFCELSLRVEDLISKSVTLSKSELSEELEEIRYKYDQVCQLIENVHAAFSAQILINAVWIFYNSIFKLFTFLYLGVVLFYINGRYSLSILRDDLSMILKDPIKAERFGMSKTLENKFFLLLIKIFIENGVQHLNVCYSSLISLIQVWFRMYVIVHSSSSMQSKV